MSAALAMVRRTADAELQRHGCGALAILASGDAALKQVRGRWGRGGGGSGDGAAHDGCGSAE